MLAALALRVSRSCFESLAIAVLLDESRWSPLERVALHESRWSPPVRVACEAVRLPQPSARLRFAATARTVGLVGIPRAEGHPVYGITRVMEISNCGYAVGITTK